MDSSLSDCEKPAKAHATNLDEIESSESPPALTPCRVPFEGQHLDNRSKTKRCRVSGAKEEANIKPATEQEILKI